MAAIASSQGVSGGNGTGGQVCPVGVVGGGGMGSAGVVSGGGMTPIGGQMVVGGGGGVMDDPMGVAAGTNSSRPYDTPERRSSIRIRGQSVVNDGRNVK